MLMHVCGDANKKCEPLSTLIKENDELRKDLADLAAHCAELEAFCSNMRLRDNEKVRIPKDIPALTA